MSLRPCTEYEQSLVLMASDTADAAESQHLHSHLRECPTCRAELERLRRLVSVIEMPPSAISGAAAPRRLHVGLMVRLRAESGAHPKPTRRLQWLEALESWISFPRGAWRVVAAGATAIVVMLAIQRITTEKRIPSPIRTNIAG